MNQNQNKNDNFKNNALDFVSSNNNSEFKHINSGELFGSIIGYDDIKKIFTLSFLSEKPVHILLVGPPASAKTLFLMACMKLERSYFALGSHSSKVGMLDYLFEKRPRYFIIDEIEHMPLKDQTVLLSLMETGIITETKHQKQRSSQLKTWVFASCNNKDKLLTPILSRFIVLHFKQYSFDNFVTITKGIFKKEILPEDIAYDVAKEVWYKLKSKDIRDCLKLGRMCKTKEEIEWLVKTIKHYK